MKTKLISKLVELFRAVGETPTPHLWENFSTDELGEMISATEEALRLRGNSVMRYDSEADQATTKRNDAQWFSLGGTRD
jgi:hypothetical protein